MNYNVKFIYFDNEKVDVILEEDQIPDFFRLINSGEIYWGDKEKKNGFWLNLDKVRYIQFLGISDDQEVNNGQEQIKHSERQLHPEDDGDSCTKGVSESE